MSTIEKVKCLIIGSGPAGFTAAIYASRANMFPVLYQGIQPGGQLTTTTDVDNFPGYAKGVNGTQMMVDLEEQAKRFGTDVRSGMITKVDFTGPVHKVWVDNKLEIHSDTIVISTGASARYLGLDSEQHYLSNGGGVSACAVCDGFFYKGQETVIVGAGDSACEEASYLANICTKVTMLVRRDEFRASKIMADRVREIENIEILLNTEDEKPLSIEMIFPDGKKGFQENAGVTHYGGYFTNFSKKSFRIYFRGEYGTTKLRFPIFDGFEYENPPAQEFDSINFKRWEDSYLEYC